MHDVDCCPICFKVRERQVGLCGHAFCAGCVHKFCRQDVRCPLCRRAFVRVKSVLQKHAWFELWRGQSRRGLRVLSPQVE